MLSQAEKEEVRVIIAPIVAVALLAVALFATALSGGCSGTQATIEPTSKAVVDGTTAGITKGVEGVKTGAHYTKQGVLTGVEATTTVATTAGKATVWFGKTTGKGFTSVFVDPFRSDPTTKPANTPKDR